MYRIYILAAVLVLAVGLMIGCTDKTKDNPTRPTVANEGLEMQASDKFYAVFASTSHDIPRYGHRGMRYYLPPDYNTEGSGRSYPILYILAPFRADERYFFEHGLKTVADRLIEEGKIQPMIIATIDGRSYLGGSFYTNSPLQGNFFDLLFNDYYGFYDDYGITGRSYMSQLESGTTHWARVIQDRDHRAVSGVGMGGYGAFKSVIETDLFGSVSAVNAPLDFDGTGSGGFLSLTNEIYPPGSDWFYIDSVLKIDTVVTDDTIIVSIDTTIVRIDTLNSVDTVFYDNGEPSVMAPEAMALMISVAAAFSPQPTAFRIDSLYLDQFDVQAVATTVTDSQTTDKRSYLRKYAVHMPFDSTGALNNAIWQLWLDHDIASLYAAADPGNAAYFESMPKLLIMSQGAEMRFDEQMAGFIQFLNSGTMDYELKTFSGNQILTGTSDHFLYDLLEDILIFHSNHFPAYE